MRKFEQQPFSSFGNALKSLREKHSKSHAELSGAVEIEIQKLHDYESGIIRPSEDILMLIIQHFDLEDDEAKELWRLAGYTDAFGEAQYFINDEDGEVKQTKTVVVSQQDARIVYTDMLQVMVNNYGVIINFMQGAGVNSHPLAVSRVGMSKEHARSLVEILTKTLKQAEEINKPVVQKQLSANSQNKQKD